MSSRLERTYGISDRVYQLILRLQRGKCWICRRPPAKRRLSVDHDHKTGRVRGLLCFRCNRGVRWFDEHPARLRKAAAYLELDFDGRTFLTDRYTILRNWLQAMNGDYE